MCIAGCAAAGRRHTKAPQKAPVKCYSVAHATQILLSCLAHVSVQSSHTHSGNARTFPNPATTQFDILRPPTPAIPMLRTCNAT